MPDPLLSFEDVSLRSSEGRQVFAGLRFTLEADERAALRGETGAGSTALLRLAAGLAHPQEGRVLLEGQPLGPYTFRHPALSRGFLGWVPTDGGLVVNLSLMANLCLPLRFVQGLDEGEAEARALEALGALDLVPLADQRPHGLEPRERWLGALARASAMGAGLWLVDRPPGDLDARSLEAARALLREQVAGRGAAALFVDDGNALMEPTRLLDLRNGRALIGDTP